MSIERRRALEARLLGFADLCCENPIPGEMGDVAYELIRQAAAQIASDRKRIEECPARYSMHGCPNSFRRKEHTP